MKELIEMPDFLEIDNGLKARFQFSESSFWFKGHFPNSPILPAVAQLLCVEQCARKLIAKDIWIKDILQMKFTIPIEPNDQLELEIRVNKRSAQEDQISFVFYLGNKAKKTIASQGKIIICKIN